MAFDVERFIKTIQNISTQQVEAARSDKTIIAEIISIENVEVGKYKVEYQGNTFSVISTNTEVVYEVGEQVYVLVPQGDFSTQKVILGHSSQIATEEKEDLQTDFYLDASPNLVEQGGLYSSIEELKICAASDNQQNLLESPARYSDNGFELATFLSGPNAESFQTIVSKISQFSNSYEYIKISGEFKTNFISQHTTGAYGLKVYFLSTKQGTGATDNNIETLNNEDYVINELQLGFANFSGAPYNYVEYTKQTAYFKVPKGIMKSLYRIELVQDGKFIADVSSTTVNTESQIVQGSPILNANNIFVRNIEICFAQPIHLTDSTWYAYVSTPRGKLLYEGQESVELHPHLLYKGKDILNKDNCEVIWFRQKTGTTIADVSLTDKDEHNKTWFDYGGNGWYPITKLDEERLSNAGYWSNGIPASNNDAPEAIWNPYYTITDDGVLKIQKNAVKCAWQYKVVIIYRDNTSDIYSAQEFSPDPITIIRTDSTYKIELEKYIKDLEYTLLRIRDYNHDPYTEDKTQWPADKKPWREWFGKYWLEKTDGSYEQINDPQVTNGFHLGVFDISQYMIYPVVRIHVQCYDPYEIDPQNTGTPTLTTVEEITDLTFESMNVEEAELTVTWEGRSAFYYDSTGSLKQWAADRDNVLKPSLAWFNDNVAAYSIKIYGPGDLLLATRAYVESNDDYYIEQGTENTQDCPDSMITGMYLDQDNCIHFKVREKFDEAKTDNVFRIVIESNSSPEPFEIFKEIAFIKDGDQGTIGGEWTAPIYPCNFVKRNNEANEVQFAEKLDSQQTVPLVVHINATDSSEKWIQNNNFRIAIRPFVTKNGVRIENIDPYEGYYYKCFWDVRTPNSIDNALAKNASFLRLYHVVDGSLEDNDSAWNNRLFNLNANGTLGENTSVTRINPNEGQKNGLVAITSYPNSIAETNSVIENYGAVEVRFFDNRCPGRGDKFISDDNTLLYAGTGASLEDIQYRFVVKCQVDVFKGTYDQEKKTISPSGSNSRVASIISFYPVDIIFTTQLNSGNTSFYHNFQDTTHPLYGFTKNMQINWPRYIQYSGTGYNPITAIDANGLQLKVGDGDPAKLTNYLAENLTPLIQEVEDIIDEETGKVVKQVYKPSTHLNMTEGFCGALRTIPGRGFFGEGDSTSFFVRNQVMYLNSYNNIDINGWDGQGIDMNEDDGTIFAATLGAGFKEPTTNLFTGVIMGMDKSQKRENIKGSGITYDSAYIESHPYLTGIFGYQDGISSFGLMENGTGFFGRADRGGRIIFDGNNATMYGGANGIMGSPKIGDPMWNTMRLSFVDLTHSTHGKEFVSVKGANGEFINQGYSGSYFKDSNTTDSTGTNYLPKWYRKIWENAYVKPDGKLPYWLVSRNSTERIIYDELPEYDGSTTARTGSDSDSAHTKAIYATCNFRLNYYHPDGIWYEPNSEISADVVVKAKEYYEKDPLGVYDTEHDIAALTNINYKGQSKREVYVNLLKETTKTIQRSGFGASRASTTPAIEIGQHVSGLMPGILDWEDYQSVFKELRIPGDRNFMVTYDGTMWAMNGIFMGAIIGSNIVGGRIQGAEIGIGDQANSGAVRLIQPSFDEHNYMNQSIVEETEYSIQTLLQSKGGGPHLGFYVSPKGEVVANDIAIYGGRIDVGHFHILGKEAGAEHNGHLIQMADSDFVGETHFYGGVGILPKKQKAGNFFQTSGLVALGIPLEKHKDFTQSFWTKQNSSINYVGQSGSGINGTAFNQGCFFGLNFVPTGNTGHFSGHFWPLNFRYNWTSNPGVLQAYATVSNIFANTNNYFRIGPWGSEGIQHYIKTAFQDEEDCAEPNTANSFGWLGRIDNDGMGLKTWGEHKIVLDSNRELIITSNNNKIVIGIATKSGNYSTDTENYSACIEISNNQINFKCLSLLHNGESLEFGGSAEAGTELNVEVEGENANISGGSSSTNSGTSVTNVYNTWPKTIVLNDSQGNSYTLTHQKDSSGLYGTRYSNGQQGVNALTHSFTSLPRVGAGLVISGTQYIVAVVSS